MAEVEKHYVDAYKSTISLLAQRDTSVVEPLVEHQSIKGEQAALADQFGKATVREKTERHEDTKYSETPRYRRWITPREFYSAELVDESDIIRMLTDPKSTLAQAHVAAMNRKKDSIFLDAIFGTALAGRRFETQIAWPGSTYEVAADIEVPSTLAGLTPRKLIEARRLFGTRHINTRRGGERPTLIVPPDGTAQVENQLVFTSNRDAIGGFLESGDAPNLLGWNIVELDADDDQTFPGDADEWFCPAFVKSGVVMGKWDNLDVNVQKHPTKVKSWEVKLTASFNYTRLDESKVLMVRIKKGGV